MGGEEFLLVFPAVSEDEALRRCEDVRRAIELVTWDGAMAGETVTVSVGFTVLQSGTHQPGRIARSGGSQPLRREAPGKEPSCLRRHRVNVTLVKPMGASGSRCRANAVDRAIC